MVVQAYHEEDISGFTIVWVLESSSLRLQMLVAETIIGFLTGIK